MSILTNRHFVIALIVAPILAVIAWFAVDKLVAPPPVVAQAGQSFELIPRPNCRYESGRCELVNGDVKIKLEPRPDGQLSLMSNLPVQFSRAELLDHQAQSLQQLNLNSPEGRVESTLAVSVPYEDIQSLRIALNIEGVFYYAETATVFLDHL